MRETMVKLEPTAHDILKKWKRNLSDIGIRVPLGGTIREMDRRIHTKSIEGISKTDLNQINHAMDILRETFKKYDRPYFSDVVRQMDDIIKSQDGKNA